MINIELESRIVIECLAAMIITQLLQLVAECNEKLDELSILTERLDK